MCEFVYIVCFVRVMCVLFEIHREALKRPAHMNIYFYRPNMRTFLALPYEADTVPSTQLSQTGQYFGDDLFDYFQIDPRPRAY